MSFRSLLYEFICAASAMAHEVFTATQALLETLMSLAGLAKEKIHRLCDVVSHFLDPEENEFPDREILSRPCSASLCLAFLGQSRTCMLIK